MVTFAKCNTQEPRDDGREDFPVEIARTQLLIALDASSTMELVAIQRTTIDFNERAYVINYRMSLRSKCIPIKPPANVQLLCSFSRYVCPICVSVIISKCLEVFSDSETIGITSFLCEK